MKPRNPSGNSASNDVANGVGPTGSPYGGAPEHDDRQWNPPVADEEVPPGTEEKLQDPGGKPRPEPPEGDRR